MNVTGGEPNRMTASPMIEVKPYIVEMIGQLAKMRQPITCRQVLELANSLVEGKSIMTKLNDWRRKQCSTFKQIHKEGADSILLGPGYWRGFMQRNGHLVKAKRGGVKFDVKRSEWCTVQNFQQMYEDVYEELSKTVIATKLGQPAWFNQEGSIVQLEEEAFGLKSQ